MTSNRKRVLLFVIKSIFLIFRADDFTKSFLANLPFCRQPLLSLFYPFGFQYFVVLFRSPNCHISPQLPPLPLTHPPSRHQLPTSPVPLLHPVPTTDYSLSLSSFCLVPSVISFSLTLFLCRPFGQFFLVITVYSVANTNLCTSACVKFFYPTLSFSQCLIGFPISSAIPLPSFSFVLVQSGSSKSFLHSPFIPPLCPLSVLIINLLETFSHSKFPLSPTPLTSPRCPFKLPSPAHLTLLFYPVLLLFSTFFPKSLTIEFLFPIRRTSSIFSYLYNLTNLSHYLFEPVL